MIPHSPDLFENVERARAHLADARIHSTAQQHQRITVVMTTAERDLLTGVLTDWLVRTRPDQS